VQQLREQGSSWNKKYYRIKKHRNRKDTIET
jgi:hypothetical protein